MITLTIRKNGCLRKINNIYRRDACGFSPLLVYIIYFMYPYDDIKDLITIRKYKIKYPPKKYVDKSERLCR